MADNRERGSALMAVIIVLLVLSVIGVAMVSLMEEERNTTFDDMYSRQALYAAEVGLRVGEGVLFNLGEAQADVILQRTPSSTATLIPAAVPQDPGGYDLQNLGTYLADGAGLELVNRRVNTADGPMNLPLSLIHI